MNESPLSPSENPFIDVRQPSSVEKVKKSDRKVTIAFSFPFIQKCVPLIAAAAIVWVISSIFFRFVYIFPVDMPTITIIVLVMVVPWVGVIFSARNGKQTLALILLFIASVTSGLAGSINPFMIRIPLYCVIIIGLWWIWGHWIYKLEHRSGIVTLLIILGILVDLVIYWALLTLIFQGIWIDWVLYVFEALFMYSALVYDSFNQTGEEIAKNRAWAVVVAILYIFIAFMIFVPIT